LFADQLFIQTLWYRMSNIPVLVLALMMGTM
jgi:hypothetical protein